MYYTYILYSPASNRFYRGSTQDLDERCRRHNAAMEPATANATPWILIWATPKPDRGAAQLLEYKLKNLNLQRLLRFVRKYDQDLSY
jgi:predicted GIY-YIG superfamily endonuclease